MSSAIEVKVPFENVNDEFAKLVAWEVKAGEEVVEGQTLCKLETTKAVYDLRAPAAGRIAYSVKEGAEVPVGATICFIQATPAIASSAADSPVASSQDNKENIFSAAGGGANGPGGDRSAAPGQSPLRSSCIGAAPSAPSMVSAKAKALIQTLKIDPSIFAGAAFVGEAEVRAAAASLGIDVAGGRGERFASRTPLERSKQFENKELLAADRSVLKSTLHVFCPATDLASAAAPASRLALLLHGIARSLAGHRHLNSALQGNQLCIYQDIDLGFAVDMDRGLKVLVIRKADTLDLPQLNDAVEDLMVKYMTDSLAVADVTGSTFTVTDLSGQGVLMFEPLINNAQCAILGLGAETNLGGQRGFMLSCAFDHRLTGGKQVAEFLGDLARRLAATSSSAAAAAGSPAAPSPAADEPYCARCLNAAAELRPLGAFLLASAEPKGYVCSVCLLAAP